MELPKKKKAKAKSDKLFRFQSFTERIASIKIDVSHQIRKTATDVPDENETFFGTALQKWRELNCTSSFVQFHKEVAEFSSSLPQLVHHKDQLILSLLHHLQLESTLAHEALLDLVVQLARDLQSDFYPHFAPLFPVLVSLCVCHDAQLIQNAFVALAHLFKFLWRHMLKDIDNVYSMYSQLLVESQKPHIRQFATESFGFLLRKVRDHDKLLDMIFTSLTENAQLVEGVGQLIFEVCKGVSKQFHSCTEKILLCSLEKLSSTSLPCELVFQSLSRTVQLMTEYTRREFSTPLWSPLLSHSQKLLDHWQACPDSIPLTQSLVQTLHLVGVAVTWRKGSRIMDEAKIVKMADRLLSSSVSLPHSLLSVSLHLVTSLILVATAVADCHSHFPQLLRLLCARGGCGEVMSVLECFRELANDHQNFQTNILPECLKYCVWVCSSERNHTHIIHFLAELCLNFDPKWAHPDSMTPAGDFKAPLSPGGSGFVLPLEYGGGKQLDDALEGVVTAGLIDVGNVGMETGLREDESWSDVSATTWAALLCLQYIRPLSQTLAQAIKKLYLTLTDILRQTTPTHHHGNRCSILTMMWSQTVSTLCSSLNAEELTEYLSWDDILLILRTQPSSPLLLSAALSYLKELRNVSTSPSPYPSLSPSPSPSPSPSLQDVLPLLQNNLCSPSSHVRVLTLEVFGSCLPGDTGDTESDTENASETGSDTGDASAAELVETCLKAEGVPPILTEFREKLRCLERLKYNQLKFNSLPAIFQEIPLRFLIGSLYVNFSLLWEPINNLIITYAVEDRKKLFWEVFGSLLEKASLPEHVSVPIPPPENLNWYDSILALAEYQYTLVCGMEQGRPDHANYRQLLWKCLSCIPAFAEPRSRILVPLVLQFIEREYILREDNLMQFQDLRNDTSERGSETEEEDFDEREEMPDNMEGGEEGVGGVLGGVGGVSGGVGGVSEGVGGVSEGVGGVSEGVGGVSGGVAVGGEVERETKEVSVVRKSSKGRKKKSTGRASGSRKLTKILMDMLRVFSKFQNPKALYRQDDLHNLYMKLLTHSDTEVQQLAIDCLMTYKPPHLVPYYDNLERLLENAAFREEVLNFNTDSTCCVVAEEHRPAFIPILIRILYGRIQRPSGVAISRVGVASRRAAVLQFLAGCEGEEMHEFFSLLLLPFHSLLDSEDGRSTMDISRVIPLKKQHGFLTMLAQIFSVLGPLIEAHLHTFLSLLLSLAQCHQHILDSRHLIQPVFVTIVKNLRQLVIMRLIESFKIFTSYNFSPFEDRIYNCIVWPQLVKLPNESIQHPTPLMKLLVTWTKFSRYHWLLSRQVPDHVIAGSPQKATISLKGPEIYPGGREILYYMYKCLFSPGVSERVTSAVLEMTLDLLEERDTQSTDSSEMKEEGSGNGVKLVEPFIPTLLTYLGGKVRARGEKAEGEGGNLQLEFSVLSRISSYVSDTEECGVLVSLLLPFVSAAKYKKHQDRILVTLQNLLRRVDGVKAYFRPLSRFFSQITARQNRNTLCNIFQILASKSDKWRKIADIVTMLNKWDSRHIDEPAYETRQEGYAAAGAVMTASEVWTLDSVLPFLYNAIFTLNMSEEMSLRDAASSFISRILTHTQTDDGERFDYLVMNVIVTAVKQGLRAKQEFTRLEFVSLLSSLVKTYPHHPRFSDMAAHLIHEDKEVDFFENVCHLQLHRRTKAMRRLACACRDGLLSPHSVTGFLVPLANQVVFHSTSNVEQNLVTESVNVISGMCSQLKWTKYCYFLRHYLRLLTKKSDVHKTLIRVVVGILDAFHFDVLEANSASGAAKDVGRKGMMVEVGREEEKAAAGTEVESPCENAAEERGELEEERGEREEEMDEGEREGCVVSHLSEPQKIHDTIVQSILPSLNSILTKGSSGTPSHKLSSKSRDQEAHMLRIPVAMAMTKLLLHLPKCTLTTHLPSLLLKVCETLKNRLCDVRDAARDTLVKMTVALGPSFLPYIVKEMKDLLTRGYQLHVLAYSLHSILNGARSILKTGDLDPSLDLISEILVEDLFGVPAEERVAGETVAKIPESKRPQSGNSYCLVAQFISPRLLPQLLAPVKEILDNKATSRTCHVAEEVFRRVGYGILANSGFTPQAILVFVYSLVNDAIPQLSTKPHPPSVTTSSRSLATAASQRPPDSRLISKEPGRANPKPATQTNVAAHVITEFGLQVLRASFKRNRFDSSSTEQLQMLDPFLPLLTHSLSSRHTKVLTHSLHCLLPLLRLPLLSLDTNVHRLVAGLLGVLRKFARSGEMSGTNRELIVAAFKAVTVMLRDVKQAQISEEELKLLLGYVEEDIHDYQRQLTAFPLLRAILGRKFVVEDMHKLMYKIAQLSVTSDSDTTRQQCRQAVVHYVMDYPLGKRLKQILDFYVSNLSYEDQNGRESVIEFFSLIFTKFPDLLVHRYATFFFLPLSSQLANDDSPTCKEMICQTLSSLFKRLNSGAMSDVVAMVKVWMSHKQLLHRRLAVQVVGLVAESLGQSFEAHLSIFLPLFSECLHMQHDYTVTNEGEGLVSMAIDGEKVVTNDVLVDGNVEVRNDSSDDDCANEEGLTRINETESEECVVGERSLDHFLFGVVQVLCKIFTTCTVIRSPVYRHTINCILEQVDSLLLHPHAWVRLASCQFFGLHFATYKPQDLVPTTTPETAAAPLSGEGTREREAAGRRRRKRKGSSVGVVEGVASREYLLKDPVKKVPDLCHVFCMQLSSHLLSQELANQAVKNLVFLAKTLQRLMEAGHMTSDVDHVISQPSHVTSVDGSSTRVQDNMSSTTDDITDDRHDKSTTEEGCHGDDGTSECSGRRSVRDLDWLIGRMNRLARFEAGKHPQQALKRTSVLQWTAAISLDLGPAHLPSYLPSLLTAPYRELTDTNRTAGEALYTLVCEVVEVMKGVCGKEEFAKAYSIAHRRALDTREKRRKQAAMEAIINPEKAVRRKQRKHLLTRASKRRRILLHRPSATAAKRLRTK